MVVGTGLGHSHGGGQGTDLKVSVLGSEPCPGLLLKGGWGKAGPGIKYLGRVRFVEECSGSGRRVGDVSFLAKGVRS